MNKVELSLDMNPIERLRNEIEYATDEAKKQLGELLLEEFEKNELITNEYKTKGKTLLACYEALERYARQNSRMAISDKEAVGIVLHFIQETEIEPHIDNKITFTVEEEQDLKKRAYEQFIEEEKLRLRQEENERIEKEQKEQEKVKERAEKKIEKISAHYENSLFDL